MRPTLLFFLILISITAYSQDTLYTSYDNNLQPTADSLATHRGILIKEAEGWRASVYNRQNSKLVVICYLTQNDFKLDGLYRIYSENGNIIERGYYHDNLKEGLWKTWDDYGHIIDSTIYEHHRPKIGSSFQYINNLLQEYRFVDYFSNHRISKDWNENEVLIMEADFLGKKGVLKNYYSKGQLASLQEFDEKGKQLFVKYFNEEAEEIDKQHFDQIAAKHKAEAEAKYPEFPGGTESLENFIKNNFIKVVVAGSTQQYPRKLEIEFYLNKDGRIINFKSINVQDATINHSLTMLFNKMPSWKMKGYKSWGPLYHTIMVN